jgi:hypothetical protein
MNLVLGAIKGLEFDELKPFLHSLFETGFDGKVAFSVSRASQTTCKALDDLGVEIITVNEQNTFTATPINSLRYFVYEQYVAGLAELPTRILLADVRDVVFQRNPFEIELGDGLCCFLENEVLDLATCVANSGWLACAYGKDVLERIGRNRISCSGTTIGTGPAVRAYLAAITAGLRAIDERTPNIMHVIAGIDQCVHNYLLYSDALPGTRLYSNEFGPIATLNYVNPADFRFDDLGLLLNHNGAPYHILHQYDRHIELAARVLRRIEEGPARRVNGG